MKVNKEKKKTKKKSKNTNSGPLILGSFDVTKERRDLKREEKNEKKVFEKIFANDNVANERCG
jgi:hypothetical protein